MIWVLGITCWLVACVAIVQALHIGALRGEIDVLRRWRHQPYRAQQFELDAWRDTADAELDAVCRHSPERSPADDNDW